ncbi:MAG: S24/S26 family peptidase [Clostridia bacterium]|nr:S24/S26 family peptidase [Clostridia bacterium]
MHGIETILKEEKIFIGQTKGDSMEPMLCGGRDTVIIVPPRLPLSSGDVPVYRRGGHYTMHRIIKVTKYGYLICGDNRPVPEKNVKTEDIIGVLAAFYHDGKYVDCKDAAYLAYTRKICRTYPLRRFRYLLKRIPSKLKELIGKDDSKCN